MKKIILQAGIGAIALLAVTQCLFSPSPDDRAGGPNRLYVCGTDFVSGWLGWLDLDSLSAGSGGLAIYSDALVKSHDKSVYVIERFGADNILKYDPTGDSIVYHTHLGDNWNPADMLILNETKAYVSLENRPGILIFNPTAGAATGEIQTSDYIYMPPPGEGMAATSPHAHKMIIRGDVLYVLLQRRNGDWASPPGPAMILKIDITTDQILGTIPLLLRNPSDLIILGPIAYVASVGVSNSLENTGGIEMVDLNSEISTLLMDETEIGGEPSQLAHRDGNRFYVQSYIAWGRVEVRLLDLTTLRVEATVPGITDAFGGILYAGGRLYVGERDASGPGLLVFDEEHNLLAGPVTFPVPPISLTALRLD